ncbi:MAG: hypothetical protein JSS64_00575 [Bacteroidetes bacterium]|nr:hypothetical protein [Bacteroidota bacterium]
MDIIIVFLFMGFNRKLLITTLCCLYISHIGIAQYIPKKIKQHLTNCYDSGIIKQNILIEMGGYYLFKEVEKRCYGYGLQMICEDTFKFGVIFYNDGTYIDDISGKEGMNFEEYAGYIKEKKNYKELEKLGHWGIYRLHNNTIIAQSIFDPGYRLQLYKWYITETRYKILDNYTLEIVSRQLWDGQGKTFGLIKEEYLKPKYLHGKFVPFNNLPPPNSWLKKLDWIWCDKSKK